MKDASKTASSQVIALLYGGADGGSTGRGTRHPLHGFLIICSQHQHGRRLGNGVGVAGLPTSVFADVLGEIGRACADAELFSATQELTCFSRVFLDASAEPNAMFGI